MKFTQVLSMNKKALYSVCRMLHIYISTALFTLLIFFCVSGVLLNHLSWLSGTDKTTGMTNGYLPEPIATQLQALGSTNDVIGYIETQYQLRGLSRMDWDKESNELMLDYPVPAGYALVIVDTVTNAYAIEYQQGNMLSILNDLHKGRHSGKAWSWVIDLTAILMCLFALTGLIILFQHKKKRNLGLWFTLLGTLTPLLIYMLYVPRLSGLST